MDPVLAGLASAIVAAILTYLGTVHRSRTDVSLDDRSAYREAQKDLQEFFKAELEVARRERDELKAENHKLWMDLRELVKGAETLRDIHEATEEGQS